MGGWLEHPQGKWRVGMDDQGRIVHLGLDSEGTGRQVTNLLAAPAALEVGGGGKVTWTVRAEGPDLVWDLACEAEAPGLTITLPIDPLMAAADFLPAGLAADSRGMPPWLLVAPDFGHLLIEVESPFTWRCSADGGRGGSSRTAPVEGVDPRLRGQAWLEAINLPDYQLSRLSLFMQCDDTLPAGSRVRFRLRPVELSPAQGVPADVWRRLRRPYLNHWQPACAGAPGRAMLLANNVISDPASCSLAFYAEPMLFWREPAPGIDVTLLLRHTLDHWLAEGVGFFGHVTAFGRMFDLYLFTGTSVIASARHYWRITDDTEWLAAQIEKLHLIADFIVRRDLDGDGLAESIQSGNAGRLRDPDRGDIWFESMHFGHKSAYTNALAYRAFLYLAEMLEATGHAQGAAYYRRIAGRLRRAYIAQLLSPEHGWFVSWISQDGEVHDYCHTFVNGMAVAFGIVPPDQGREILERVVRQSHAIGFENWHLGVPGNLLPCRRADLIGPRTNLDGEFNPVDRPGDPGLPDWPGPPGYIEPGSFGNRYPDGTIHPVFVWPYLLGLQVAGLDDEAERILTAMIGAAEEGLFQNGIVNVGFGGAEHFKANGRTLGYEGYLPESYNFLMACFTRDPANRRLLLDPLCRASDE